MTRHGILTAAGGVLLALALLPALWPADAAAAVCPETDSVQLTVGQTKDAGDVKVCNDGTTLTITYEATYPFCLLETDLHVATSVDAIPQNKQKSPTPGQFAYGDVHGCVGTAPFEIPLEEIDGGVIPGEGTVVIAAHAKLEDEDGKVEEAWGQGTRFVPRGGNWAMYFTYTVEEASFLCGGADSKCVFVTSTTNNGNLGGLAGGDAICQARAEANGSLAAPGTYKAWLSDSSNSPAGGRFTQSSVPYRLVDGTAIASHWTDLVDGTLAAPIDRDEAGGFVERTTAWTGTTTTGTAGVNHCDAWFVGSFFTTGRVGGTDATDSTWTDWFDVDCFAVPRLYCFQQ